MLASPKLGLYSISLQTNCEHGDHLKYDFSKRMKPNSKSKNLLHRLSSTVYLLPTLLVVFFSGAIAVSAHSRILNTANASTNISIASPAADSTVSGTIQLKASLNGQPNSAYDMFWYVDNGKWNWMDNTNDNAKQASVDLTNWTWHGSNHDYTITLVTVMHGSGQRDYSGVPIHIGQSVAAPANATAPTPTTTTPASSTSSTQLYVNPSSEAASTAANTSDATTKRVMTKLAQTPTATWFGGWNSNVQSDVSSLVNAAAGANQTPVMVIYNIPNRDCGGYSAGGAQTPDAYKSWVQSVAAGIGNHNAIVIVEPDGTASQACLSSSDVATRDQLLSFAVSTLKANASTKVYLDAGNPTWIKADDMAGRLKAAGIDKADGFSLNVSNFIATSDNISYGAQLSQLIGNKHFVIDTGRNGNGSNGEWCNPSGRALGQTPTSNTGNALVDYFLWVKTPGESDGSCNGGPAAGVWWPSYAVDLAVNAGW